MNKNILDKIEGLKYSVSDEYNEVTSKVNSLTTDTYNTISKSLNDVTNIKNKISVISDMFTDLRVLNGTAKNMVYLSTLPVVENSGVKVKDDRFTLDTLIKTNKEIYVKESSLSSVEKYKLYTLDGKGTTLDTFLKSGVETLVQFDNTRYTFTLNLRYSTIEQINSIELQLGLLTESYPIINSIKYVDKDNVEKTAVILNNTSSSYDLDYNREVDNQYILDIAPILTNQINIELTSKTSSSIILKNIKTYFKKEIESAEIIVGPIHTEKPLLKVALDCEELTKGCSFELSTDLDYWLKLDSSSIITDELNTKILSFNTINEKSIKTTEDIYTFYIKIFVESTLLTNDDVNTNIYNTLREDNSINNDTLELVDDNLFSAYKVKNSDFIYGQYQYIENLNIKELSIKNIEYLEVNGNSKVLGLIDTPYSITDKTENSSGGVGGELKLKRLPADFIINSTQYDVANSKVHDIFLRDIEDTINTREKDNLCLTLKKTKKAVVEPDFSAPYDISHTTEDITWIVNPEYNLEGTTLKYTAYSNNTNKVYDSYAEINIEDAIVASLHDNDMQKWQAVKDAANELTGIVDWTFDNNTKVIKYFTPQEIPGYGLLDPETNKPTTSTVEQLCSSLIQSQFKNSSNMRNAKYSGFTQVNYSIYCDLTVEIFDGYDWNTSTTQADKSITIYQTENVQSLSISYQQLAQKIISNASSSDQAIALLAEAYLEAVAESFSNSDTSKQYVNKADLDSSFEANLYNFGAIIESYDVTTGLTLDWTTFGQPSTLNLYVAEGPIEVNTLPAPYTTGLTGNHYSDLVRVETSKYVRLGSIKNGRENLSEEMIIHLDFGDWTIQSVAFDATNILYNASKTNGRDTYTSTVVFNKETAITRSLADTDMQQWQAVKDAVNQLALNNSYKWTTTGISYVVSSLLADPSDQIVYSCETPGFTACTGGKLWKSALIVCQEMAKDELSTCASCCTTLSGNVLVGHAEMGRELFILSSINPDYNPAWVNPNTEHVTFSQISQKIISNTQSSNEAISLLAEAYLDDVANSIFNTDESKQFIKVRELESQFEQNKVIRV